MISPTDLLYFIEVAKTKHVSRAAERLGVTQPTLSHSLQKSEHILGHQLFLRSKKGVRLTAAGESFFRHAEALLTQWEDVRHAIDAEVHQPQGLVRLGCHTAVAQYTLATQLPRFMREYPKIQFRITHGLSRHLAEAVISSSLDLAIVVNPPAHPDLVIKEICTDRVTVWKSKNCMNPDLLILEPNLRQTQDILKKLNKNKTQFSRSLESASLEVVAQMVANGLGCGIVPERVMKAIAPSGISMVPGAPTYKDRICLVFKPEFKKTKRGELCIQRLGQIESA